MFRTVDETLVGLLAAVQPVHHPSDERRYLEYTAAVQEAGRLCNEAHRLIDLGDPDRPLADDWLHQHLRAVRAWGDAESRANAATVKPNPGRPRTPAELRKFALAVNEWVEGTRDRIVRGWETKRTDLPVRSYADAALAGYAEAIWSVLIKVANGRPFPIRETGPYTRERLTAAITRVVAWCDEQNEQPATDIPRANLSARADEPRVKTCAVKGKNINARMIKILCGDRDAYEWSALTWAERLKCSDGTVKGTECWKQIQLCRTERAREAAKHMDRGGLVRRGVHGHKDGHLDGEDD